MQTLHLHTDVLRWAREKSGLDVRGLARTLKVKPEKVQAWEETGAITFRDAEKLAKSTRVPLALLFDDEPPKLDDDLPVPDYRTHRADRLIEPSLELLDVVDGALLRQGWYSEYVRGSGGAALSLVGSITMGMKPLHAAKIIRNELPGFPAFQGTPDDRLRSDVAALEEYGIMVLRSGVVWNQTNRKLDPEEFRGFALSDEYAPLIFVNSADARTAQRFSLVHELAHIALNKSGVSNPSLNPNARHSDVEQFCNRAAAEILMPQDQINSLSIPSTPEQWHMLSRSTFGVSPFALLLRLRDAGKLGRKEANDLYKKLAEHAGKIPPKEGNRGGDGIRNIITRNGKLLTRAVVEQVFDGRMLIREGASLLGIRKGETLRKLGKEVGVGNLGRCSYLKVV